MGGIYSQSNKVQMKGTQRPNGEPIENISKNLGHKTTRTTELFYARVKDENS